MPELPEVQAHAERLTADFGGAVLSKFVPLAFHALKTAVPAPEGALGEPLRTVGRRGKYLLLDFGELTFVVHLMQGGRLKPDEKQAARPKGGLARWLFDDGRALVLTEQGTERRAGVWVSETAGVLERPPLANLGPEALDITPEELAARFAAHSMRLHSFLRDQGCIAGLGRRLANEVCHRAKLSPFASTGKLGLDVATRVVVAIHDAVDEGLEYERSRPDMSSSADRPGRVHHRTGEPCPVCGDTVREVSYARYTVNYCPTCQTGGKVLADNTTSKFLK
ncbi:MAG TPA: DNA-formamidopyrimidine glycosylase family protein [Acidimicrobiales bacterium]|nr:DNA-formamidopyrimidine glycosylase family protein [Acidimicrobiales bacterium]